MRRLGGCRWVCGGRGALWDLNGSVDLSRALEEMWSAKGHHPFQAACV